jgi:hypothetical protein
MSEVSVTIFNFRPSLDLKEDNMLMWMGLSAPGNFQITKNLEVDLGAEFESKRQVKPADGLASRAAAECTSKPA